MVYLQFIFQSFWHWLGFFILSICIIEAIGKALHGIIQITGNNETENNEQKPNDEEE